MYIYKIVGAELLHYILEYAFAPHYKSDHPESEDIDRAIEYMINDKIPFKTLKDGEEIIIK